MAISRTTDGARAVAEVDVTVRHWGFWRLPPPPDVPCGAYPAVTRDLLVRVLQGLERLP